MRNQLFFAFSVAALVAGCGNNNTTTTDMGGTNPDMTVADPVKPALATTQIERMGRGTINVAVTNPFKLDYTAVGGGATQDATRDKYNQDGNVQSWVTTWKPVLAKTLAIYDAADTKCGNQFGACTMAGGCATGSIPAAGRYDTLAGVLADDQIYVDTSQTNCSFYLAVEAAALSVPGANVFCGGRTPTVDVVDVMYTAATVGAAGFPTTPGAAFAITDGVAAQSASEAAASLTTFPFLGTPN